MAGSSYRGLRRAAAVVACLVSSAALLTGSPAAGEVIRTPFRVLQMNICGSGIAGCYTGRSVTEAAEVIRVGVPDVVTLNEVCAHDVETLGRALAISYPGGVVQAFKAAVDRRTGGAFRCRDGQPYGVGVLAHGRGPARGHATYSGIYPTQDPRDPEERVWLCVHAGFYACTTHLAATSPAGALAQCRYLLNVVVPAMRGQDGYGPTVLGADFNLRNGGSPDVRSCVPSGYLRADDGAVQDVLATADFTISSSRSIGMDGTTDHPALLTALGTRTAT